MADTKPAAPVAASSRPSAKTEKIYHLVNPKGAIHRANRAHATMRLRQPGWRLASPEEIAELEARGGLQVADRPICAPWSPDPAVQLGELE